MHGPYCAQCGQETVIERLTLRSFSHEYLQGFVSIEGRLWLTLKLLIFRPGALTVEFIQGRRRRYARPLPLYLTLSFVLFLFTSLTKTDLLQFDANPPAQVSESTPATSPNSPASSASSAPAPKFSLQAPGVNIRTSPDIVKVETDEGDDAESFMVKLETKAPPWFKPVVKRYHDALRQWKADPLKTIERFNTVFVAKLPLAVFFLVPFFALMTRLLYWRRKRTFAEHFLFALHLHSFLFLTLLASFAFSNERAVPWLVLSWLVYLALALRTMLGGRLWPQVLRAMLLLPLHSTVLGLVMLIVAIVSAAAI